MIDIHSHILPAVDDGSENVGQSLEMLKEAARQGVTDVVLTPHYRACYLTDKDRIAEKFRELKDAADKEGVKVGLYLGQEIYNFDGIENALKKGRLFTMNGGKFVLVEFPTKQTADIAEIVYMLKGQGYIPIVAHIERYYYADLETAREIKEIGGLVQVNAETVCSAFARRKIFKMIKEGLVDFVASDVHYKRVNRMEKAYNLVKKKFGEQTANALFRENAKQIIGK